MTAKKLNLRITYWLSVAAISLIIALSLRYVLAWTEPAITAPGGNTDEPLNVSAATQMKAGALGIGGSFKTDNYTYLAADTGNVGIGTTNPPEKLTLEGGNFLVTTGNIDAPTASIGNISASDITVTENMDIGNNLYVRNELNVGPGGIKSDGVIQAGSTEATIGLIKVNATSAPAACDAAREGEIIYFSNATVKKYCYCDGAAWRRFDESGTCP